MAVGSIPVFNTFGSLSEGFGLNIDLKGLAGLIPLLNDLGDRLIAEMMFEATKVFDEGYDLTQSLVHVISGHLKGSGVVTTVSGNEIVFGYSAEYAAVEEERGPTQSYESHMFFEPGAVYIQDNLSDRLGQAVQRHIDAARNG
jgi:hypothetical protein